MEAAVCAGGAWGEVSGEARHRACQARLPVESAGARQIDLMRGIKAVLTPTTFSQSRLGGMSPFEWMMRGGADTSSRNADRVWDAEHHTPFGPKAAPQSLMPQHFQ